MIPLLCILQDVGTLVNIINYNLRECIVELQFLRYSFFSRIHHYEEPLYSYSTYENELQGGQQAS